MQMTEWINQLTELNSALLGAIGFSLSTGAGLIWKQVKKAREEARIAREKAEEETKLARQKTEYRLSALEYANVAILHDKIYKQCTMFLADGWVSVDDLENLEYLWRGYSKLGGNGTGETLYREVQNLPKIRKEDE